MRPAGLAACQSTAAVTACAGWALHQSCEHREIKSAKGFELAVRGGRI